jgi:hypothetical protein
MKLSEKDADLFHSLFHSLLAYVNNQTKLIDTTSLKPKDITSLSMKQIHELRMHLYDHLDMIDSFIAENPYDFSKENLSIIYKWKHVECGDFFIFRYLKNYAVFLGTEKIPKAYGVKALKSSFEEIIGPFLPVMAYAALLPFKDKIIYDGILGSYPMSFGGGMKKGLNSAYQDAKSRFGIITQLPYESLTDPRSDAEKLKFYLKNKHNRDRYWQEINQIISKNDSLLGLYYQEMGKHQARSLGKYFKDFDLQEGWFAILNDIPISSGKTKKEAEKNVLTIIPKEKQNFIYYYHYKGKK